MILRIGIKELTKTAKPHVLYAGHDGEAAAQVIAALKPGEYARVFKVDHPMLIPLALPTVLAGAPVSDPAAIEATDSDTSKHKHKKK
jgi:hypothetical protein